jgi:ABC-type dipeptide/oligopeptide/nickel transport system ATPase component/ABC-type dipeptide/oligopeptide/nickel transport system permease subunit
MSVAGVPELTTPAETPAEAARPGLLARLIKSPLADTAIALLFILVLVGIIGPLISPHNPNSVSLADAFANPGKGHLLGTDGAGRDVLSRLLSGARTTLLAAALAATVAMVIGVPLGLIAGYFERWIDAIGSWVSNVLLALPAIIILLAVTASLGKSVFISMTVFGVLMAPGFYRLTRASVQAVRNELYVDAARVAGLSFWRIIGRHILFVVRAPIIIQASVVCGIAIAIQAGLEFLGLGDPSTPSWGNMLSDGFANIYTHPLLMLWPAAAITIATAAFIILGSALRDAVEDLPAARARGVQRRTTALPVKAGRDAQPAPGHLLAISDLQIGYPTASGDIRTVVSNVSLYLDQGEVLGLVGESGSGKTQIAFSVLGLLPANAQIVAGSVFFDSTELVGGSDQRAASRSLSALRGLRIGYIPQEPMSNLDPNFTIGYQLAHPMIKHLRLSRGAAKARARELLSLVGIPDPERVVAAYPHQISGGMAQRVLIAGAVSCKPALLIADEPTTALDVTVQAEVLDLLRDLQQQFNMAVLLVTHNFGIVADLCDRVAVMQRGSIVEAGDIRSVLRSPQHPYTQTLLSSMLESKEPLTMLLPPPPSRQSPSEVRQ